MKPTEQGRSLALIFLTVALDLVGFGMILPILPLYAKYLGADAALIGLLFASYSLMQFVFAPLWGRLSDRYGRRPVLLASIACNVVSLLVFATSQSYGWLMLSRSFSGMCTANISVANAYVADILPPSERARGMGLIGAAFGVGFVVGPFLGGELSSLGFAAAPLVASALSAINFVAAFFLLPESLAEQARRASSKAHVGLVQRLRAAWAMPNVNRLLCLVFVQVLAFSMLEMAFVLFAERRFNFGAKQSGRLLVFIGVVMVLVQGGLIGRLVKRFGERSLALIGMVMVALGMAAIPLTPAGNWQIMLVSCAWVAAGQALLGPSLSSLLSQRATSSNQGLVLGASQSMSALARAVGPSIAGLLFKAISENAPFVVGAMLMAAIGAWAFVVWRRETSLG